MGWRFGPRQWDTIIGPLTGYLTHKRGIIRIFGKPLIHNGKKARR